MSRTHHKRAKPLTGPGARWTGLGYGPATRLRRGKVVEIPEAWRGRVAYAQQGRRRRAAAEAKWREPRERDKARSRDDRRIEKLEEHGG